jgi:hypothetical protein
METVVERLSCSRTSLRRWALRWQWDSRARAWEVYEGERARDREAIERIEMRQRHAKLGMMMQEVAGYALAELAKKADQKRLKLTPLEWARLIKVGARLEKAARGRR